MNEERFSIRAINSHMPTTDSDRNIKCTSEEPMTYICIQAKEGSLGGYTITDAEITERENLL